MIRISAITAKETVDSLPDEFTIDDVLSYLSDRRVVTHVSDSTARGRIQYLKKFNLIEATGKMTKHSRVGGKMIYRKKKKI